jgi:pSer/pThr/pTyr-binding forkhead associated (FHA) protein
MPARVDLVVSEGKYQGQVFSFEEHDTFLLGRKADCTIKLPEDNLVSRHHFILEVNPPDARVRDLGSLNGTWVNDKKIGGRAKGETPEQGALHEYPQVDLKDGDKIEVGDTVLHVKVEIPILCISCDEDIPSAQVSKSKQADGSYICPKCQEAAREKARLDAEKNKLADRAQKHKPEPPKPPTCQQCGKDVSKEIPAGHQGAYICQDCLSSERQDPLALLMALLGGMEQPPPNIPDYQVQKKLGEGGMGAVYLASHKRTGKKFALKVMLSRVAVNARAREQFMREMDMIRTLKHKNIVEFIDHGSVGGVFYFLMEFCEGGSVDKLMERRGGVLKLHEAGPLMLQALEGLAYAHDHQFVHRDLKPQNIMLTGSEGAWTAEIGDLGMAKNFDKAGFSGMTVSGSYAGTYPFMPREQVTNFKYVKSPTDVWAMGATFYNMLTKSYPRDFVRGRDPVEIILHGEIIGIRKRLPSFPRSVAEVIDRSLENKAADRYQDAGEMLEALKRVL